MLDSLLRAIVFLLTHLLRWLEQLAAQRRYIIHRGPRANQRPIRIVNTPQQSERARKHWRQAVQYISRILRIRKKFARLGKYLDQFRIQELVSGLERNRGVLRRVAPASTAEQIAQATVRLRRRQNNGD